MDAIHEHARPEPDYPFLPFPQERAAKITKVLKAGTSAVLYPRAERTQTNERGRKQLAVVLVQNDVTRERSM